MKVMGVKKDKKPRLVHMYRSKPQLARLNDAIVANRTANLSFYTLIYHFFLRLLRGVRRQLPILPVYQIQVWRQIMLLCSGGNAGTQTFVHVHKGMNSSNTLVKYKCIPPSDNFRCPFPMITTVAVIKLRWPFSHCFSWPFSHCFNWPFILSLF